MQEDVRRTSFPQVSPAPADAEENVTAANIPIPTETMMGSNTSHLVPVSLKSTATGPEPYARLRHDMMDRGDLNEVQAQ